MENIETPEIVPSVEEEQEEKIEQEEDQITFDDIVSFTMLLETAVTLFSIILFFLLFVL